MSAWNEPKERGAGARETGGGAQQGWVWGTARSPTATEHSQQRQFIFCQHNRKVYFLSAPQQNEIFVSQCKPQLCSN